MRRERPGCESCTKLTVFSGPLARRGSFPGEGRCFLGTPTVLAPRQQPAASSLVLTRCQTVTKSLVKPANTGPLKEEAPARCENDLWLLAQEQAGSGPEGVSAGGDRWRPQGLPR